AIKTTTLFTYVADTLSQSVTYRNDTGSVTAPGVTVKRSVTLYIGNEGEEKADKTYNYNYAGTAIKTTTLFTYAADTLSQSVTYRNDTGSVTTPGVTVKRSITLYIGNEGEEKATTTYNYNFAGTAIKTTTLFTYAADTLSQSVT